MAPSCRSFPIVLPTRALGLLLSLPLALACQKPEGTPPPSGKTSHQSERSTPPPDAEVGEAYCYVAFGPDEALRRDVEEAAARWAVATGCDIYVADGGVPVVLVASVLRPDGSEAPGVTSAERDRIEINAHARPAQRTRTVSHELGHALGGDHVDSNGVLSGQKERLDVIDSAALDSVCSRLPCLELNPEEF